MEGIIIDDYIDKKKCKLLVIKDDGSRELYEPSASGFVKIKDYPAPMIAVTGLSTKITVEKSVLTFINGVLTKVDPKKEE
jgi:hypothetical protein